MVAKISHSDNLYGILLYNQKKVDEGEAEVLFSKDIFHSPNNEYNVLDCVKSFEDNLAVNQRTKKPIIHISLNPDPKDRIDDDRAKTIAQKYLDSMGYGNQPYMLYKHQDIDRTHYHIVTICVDENGNKINDKFEKRRSMETCRSLEKEFELSIPTRKQLYQDSLVKHVDYQKGNLSNQLKSVSTQLLDTYKITGLNEYKTLLELHGMTLSQVEGNLNGKPIHGIVYSAINEKGEKQGKPVKSSKLKNDSGYNELKAKFRKSKKQISEQNKDFIRKVATQCMYQCKNRSRDELKTLLQNRGIDLILHTNKEGRTYGVTFVDHNLKTVIKGSDLGKEYSANVLNSFFDNPYFVITEPLENKGVDVPTKEKEQGGIFLPSSSGYDANEEAFKRKMRKKKGYKF